LANFGTYVDLNFLAELKNEFYCYLVSNLLFLLRRDRGGGEIVGE